MIPMSIDWNDPKDVAEKHYKFLVEDNLEMWKETLMDDIKQQMEGYMRGTTGEFWWNARRRTIDANGIKYDFQRRETKYVSPDMRKFFFIRVKLDGEQMGYPLPITLSQNTDGKWKVFMATQ